MKYVLSKEAWPLHVSTGHVHAFFEVSEASCSTAIIFTKSVISMCCSKYDDMASHLSYFFLDEVVSSFPSHRLIHGVSLWEIPASAASRWQWSWRQEACIHEKTLRRTSDHSVYRSIASKKPRLCRRSHHSPEPSGSLLWLKSCDFMPTADYVNVTCLVFEFYQTLLRYHVRTLWEWALREVFQLYLILPIILYFGDIDYQALTLRSFLLSRAYGFIASSWSKDRYGASDSSVELREYREWELTLLCSYRWTTSTTEQYLKTGSIHCLTSKIWTL